MKSPFFTKSVISHLVPIFDCFNLAVKFSIVNSLNSGVLIYLLWLGVLFSTTVKAARVAKLVILRILFLTSFILVLGGALVTKLVILGIRF